MGLAEGLVLLVIVIGTLSVLYRRQLYARLWSLTPPRYRVAVTRGLSVATRDGITLATDHYFPVDSGTFPTILIRSPYGRNPGARGFGLILDLFVRRFAERGYHVVVQDTRGRFDSGGVFDPYLCERNDGLDTLDWLKQQPWFNGVLGTWGPSYLGIVQWALATATPAVGAMVPAITGSDAYPIMFPDGVVDLGLVLRWIALFQALDRMRRVPIWQSVVLLWKTERAIVPILGELPLSEADRKVVGEPVSFYQKWMTHTSLDDPLWQEARATMNVSDVSAPTHLIGGWYDFFLRTLLMDYATLKASGKNPYLTIGPWYHFSHAMLMTDSLHEGLIWFDANLKGDRSRMRDRPVRLYVMGSKQWRDFDSWPPPANDQRYYLSGTDGRALRLDAPQDDQPPDRYRYDPADPTPIVGGTQFSLEGGPRSNRKLEARRDVLIYTSAPLDAPLDVIGRVRLELFVKSSLDFTDFFGRLCDVQRSGESINVCDGLFRIQPSKGTRELDGSLCIEIDMWATAHRFQKGHRIRLQVSSGAHPRWYRNLGIGVLTATDTTMQAADQIVFHDRAHPSALILPITQP